MLKEMTFKGDAEDLGRRVFYTLTADDPKDHAPQPVSRHPGARTQHKTAKLLACLLVKLNEKGLLSDSEVDDLLLETVT